MHLSSLSTNESCQKTSMQYDPKESSNGDFFVLTQDFHIHQLYLNSINFLSYF